MRVVCFPLLARPWEHTFRWKAARRDRDYVCLTILKFDGDQIHKQAHFYASCLLGVFFGCPRFVVSLSFLALSLVAGVSVAGGLVSLFSKSVPPWRKSMWGKGEEMSLEACCSPSLTLSHSLSLSHSTVTHAQCTAQAHCVT